MGIKFDKFFATITRSKSINKAIADNTKLDEQFQKSAEAAIIAALEGNKINIQDEVKGVEESQKGEDKQVLDKKQTKKILENLKNKIEKMKAGYKSKDLTNLLQDEKIFTKISAKVKKLFENSELFLQNINNDVVQFIINNKTLLKKYKLSLNFQKWPKFLLGAKMNDDIQLGSTGSDIRKKLYNDFTIEGCLTILGPARNSLSGPSANIKKIEEFVKKEIKKIKKGMEEDKNEKSSLNGSDYSKYSETVLPLSIYFEKAHGYLADILGCIKDEHVKKSSIAVPDKSLTVEQYAKELQKFLINF